MTRGPISFELAFLYQLSRDDSLVQSLVDRGVISRETARTHPQRNVVLKVLNGRERRLALGNFEVHEDDRIILCTDGVSDVLPDDALIGPASGPDLEGCANDIVAAALRNGSQDNVTCIVARVARSGALD